jgi:hypothetical protein
MFIAASHRLAGFAIGVLSPKLLIVSVRPSSRAAKIRTMTERKHVTCLDYSHGMEIATSGQCAGLVTSVIDLDDARLAAALQMFSSAKQ